MNYSLLVREYTVEHIPEITFHIIVFRIWIAIMMILIGFGVFRQIMLIKNNKERVKDKIFVLHIFVSFVLFCVILLLFHEVSKLDHILTDIKITGHVYSNFNIEGISGYAFRVGIISSIPVVLFFIFRKYIFGFIPVCLLFMMVTSGGADYIFYIFISILCGFYICLNILKYTECSRSIVNKIEWIMVLYVMVCPVLFMSLIFVI